MTEILIYTGVFGILALAILNLFLVFRTYRKSFISVYDVIWISLGILAVSLISFTVFFRNIERMHWLYYIAITLCLFGMIALFLNLTRKLTHKSF